MRARSSSIRLSQARGDEGDQDNGDKYRLNMLAGKGYSWKAAQARLPPSRQIIHTVRNPRFLLSIGLLTAVILIWRSMGSATGELHRYAFAHGWIFLPNCFMRPSLTPWFQVLLLRPLQTTNAHDGKRE